LRRGNDLESIRQALNNLQSAKHAMAQHISRAGGPPPGTTGQAGGAGEDNIEDAEFEVKS
jgi:hypothetical protein